jgi:hypothetical protein
MTPSRLDIIVAEIWWGNECGHAALAAVLGVHMSEARRLMPSKYVTKETRMAALDRAGRKWRDIGTSCPAPGTHGLVSLYFSDGSAHVVAIRNDVSRLMAFDNHSARWMRLEFWEAIVLPLHKLRTWSKKCWIDSVIEVEAKRE